MKKSAIFYWLVPANPECELFDDILRILAKQLHAARFEPHLTLCRAADTRSASKVLRQIRAKPIRLRIRGVAHGSKFTKTLYIRFSVNESLRRLVADLGGDPKSLRDPHVSLVYKTLSPQMRRELATVMKLPFREVTFDRIKAIRTSIPVESGKDVEGWRVIATKRLVALAARQRSP
ncbi:MAG TPA: hypothetical protein VGM62_01850 [Chthoniobacterales bacterium]|jgi:2'-5' RNA ligase